MSTWSDLQPGVVGRWTYRQLIHTSNAGDGDREDLENRLVVITRRSDWEDCPYPESFRARWRNWIWGRFIGEDIERPLLVDTSSLGSEQEFIEVIDLE